MLFRLLVPGKGAFSTGHASSSTERASTPLQQPHHESCRPTEHTHHQSSAVTGLSPQTSQVLCSIVSPEDAVPPQPGTNAHQAATAASNLPSAAIKPLVTGNQQSHQQPVAASASRWTDSQGSPSAQPDVTEVPARYAEHMHPDSLQAGSQEGVVMLLCILSLMSRLRHRPPPPPHPPTTSPRPHDLPAFLVVCMIIVIYEYTHTLL